MLYFGGVAQGGSTNETKVIKKRMWDVVACVDFLPKEISLHGWDPQCPKCCKIYCQVDDTIHHHGKVGKSRQKPYKTNIIRQISIFTSKLFKK